MAKKLDNKNESFEAWGSDLVEVDETTDKKNVNILGTDADETLILQSLRSWDVTSAKNIDIYFDGGAGTDTLEYSGNVKNVNFELSSDSNYDFKVSGGYSSGGGDKKLNNLRVWTKDVERFALTSESDTVDVRGFHKGLTFFLKSGKDSFYGTSHDDYVDGGNGADTISAGDGNDIIVDHGGANTIYGGRGRDTIYATSDITEDGVTSIYGDYVNANGKADGAYNEADTFFIGYQTVEYDYPHATAADGAIISDGEEVAMAGAGIGLIGGNLMYYSGLSVASSVFTTGFTVGGALLGELISKGQKANSKTMTSEATNNQVLIKDFDAWGDTAVVALDEYVDLVSADVTTRAQDGSGITFSVGGTDFLDITLDTTRLSFMKGSEDDLSFLDSEQAKKDILDNLLMNSVIVESEGSLSPGANSSGAKITAMNGLDLSVGSSEQEILDSYFTGGSKDGVWLIGDIGTSILFGHNLSALAGTQSDNVMYSGYYLDEDSTSTWYGPTAITMHGGAGNDVMFGSSADKDKIYGGTGNDFLTGFGGLFDKLYGGAGVDIGSFGTIRSEGSVINQLRDDQGYVKAIGVYADLAVTGRDGSNDMYSAGYRLLAEDAEAYKNGTLEVDSDHATGWDIGNVMAYLYDVEGLYGSDYKDILFGDGGENVLIGAAGDDIINGRDGDDFVDGGAGNDLLTGGNGADTFSFTGNFGEDVIDDFADGDTLVFEGLTEYQRDSLLASLTGNGSTITMKDSAGDSAADTLTLTGIDISGLYAKAQKEVAEIYDENIDDVISQETYTLTVSTSRALDDAPLTDAEAYQYLASNPELIERYGNSLESAKAHFEAYGRNGDMEWDFNASQYAANYDLGDGTDAASHFVTTGYARGWSYKADITDSLTADAASQSSTHGSMVASNAIDNDRSTITHAATNDHTPELSIDLGGEFILDAAKLQNRETGNHWINDRLIGATVEVLDDGKVVWASNPLNDWATQYLDFEGTVGDALRITHTNTNLSVAELEIFGEAFDSSVSNLTDTLNASAASMTTEWASGEFGAEKALDGDDSTLIHSKKSDLDTEFWLDLGTDAKIQYIDIANRTDGSDWRLSRAELQVLRDGKVVWSQDLTAEHDQMINTGGVIGDEVRIVQDGAALHIGEIDVYGAFVPNALNNLSATLNANDVTQSSALSTTDRHEAGNIIDGDYTSSQHTGHGDYSPWIEVDLGEDAFLKGVLLQNRYMEDDANSATFNQKLEDATIEVLDGATVVWSSDALSGDVAQWIDFDGVVGDKIRLSSDEQYLHVAELDIIGDYVSDMINITDTLDSSAATQSSQHGASYVAENVLDGSGSTFNHTSKGSLSWLSVDLGADVDFEFIQIENRDDHYSNVTNRIDGAVVEILDDGKVIWSSDALGTDHMQFIDASGVTGDEVRVTLEDEYLHIAEIDVYGGFAA